MMGFFSPRGGDLEGVRGLECLRDDLTGQERHLDPRRAGPTILTALVGNKKFTTVIIYKTKNSKNSYPKIKNKIMMIW